MGYVKENINVLPCPFCGNQADVCKLRDEEIWLVKCWNQRCLIKPRTREYDSRTSAISAWNVRG